MPLTQGSRPYLLFDEGHPVLAQVLGEGDHRQDLGEDLQHVDVRSPGVEFSHEPTGIIPGGVARPDDIAPTIGTSM